MRAFLIDDNVFHRSKWEKALSHLEFKSFRDVNEFARQFPVPQARENTIVFLDYELNDGSHAVENAQKVLSLGFKTLFITTAHDVRSLEPVPGISGVLSKEPPEFLLTEKEERGTEKTAPVSEEKPATMKASDLNLEEILEFRPQEGKILVGSDRMLLFRKGAFASLRNMVIDQVGPTLARSILTKFAFRNGQDDYHLLAKMFRWDTEQDRLAAGPMMHAWSGIVYVEPTFMEYDRAKGHFHFKGIWKNSYEAEIHLESFGKSPTPVCSTLTGYGSGWCTAFFGSPVLEVETKCVACGDEVCEWEIRSLKDWGDEVKAEKEALYDTHDSIFRQLDQKSQDLNLLNRNLEKIIKDKTDRNRYLVRVLCHDLLPPLEVIEEITQLKDTEILQNPALLSRLQTSVAALRSSLGTVRASQIQEMEIKRNDGEADDSVSFEEITKYLTAVFHYKLQQKNLKVKVCDESKGTSVVGNRITILQQVFQNLLSNAIKFSPRDSIIEISAGLSVDKLLVTVRDRGIGIPKAQRDQIFLADIQESRLGTQGEEGTGFGLSIANYFVKQLGGSILIDSTTIDESFEKSGTVVTVQLPLGNRR